MMKMNIRLTGIFISLITIFKMVNSVYFDMARTKERCYIEDFYGKSVLIMLNL